MFHKLSSDFHPIVKLEDACNIWTKNQKIYDDITLHKFYRINLLLLASINFIRVNKNTRRKRSVHSLNHMGPQVNFCGD